MLQINEDSLDKKRLLSNYQTMDFDLKKAKSDLKDLIKWYKSLPNELILYRIVNVDDKKDINFNKLGSHYSYDKIGLSSSHSFVTGYGEKKYLITVKANKSMVDVNETLSNNILYPNEREITLKDKGKGVEILSVKKISRNKIVESSNKKLNRLKPILLKLLKSHDLDRTLKLTGLNFVNFFKIIGNSEINIDAFLANQIILELVLNKLVTTNYKGFQLRIDSWSGILEWIYNEDLEDMVAYCTPFYEGFNEVPIFVRSYENKEFEPSVYFEIEDEHLLKYENSKLTIFNNLNEVILWYENWYIPRVFNILNKYLKNYRAKSFEKSRGHL